MTASDDIPAAIQPSESELGDIRAFIASVEWRFAKTMAAFPHCYNVLRWNPEKADGFWKLVHAIVTHSYQQEWPSPLETHLAHIRKRVVTYFNVDGYRYWVMDPDPNDLGSLINRAKLE